MSIELRRYNNLDAIRLGLAVLVIYAHSFPLATGDPLREPLARWTSRRLDVGDLAVDAFFATSGYLIAMSFVRAASPGEFLRRRALRIVPGYLVAFAIAVLVVSPLAATHARDALLPRRLALAAFVAATLGPWTSPVAFLDNPVVKTVNGSLWTIRQEVFCYLLLFVVGRLGLLRRRRVVLVFWSVGLAASAAIRATSFREAHRAPSLFVFLVGDPYEWPRLISFFLAGTLGYLYAARIARRTAIAAFAFVAITLASFNAAALAIVMPAAVTYLLFWLAGLPTPRLHGLARAVGGDYSYGTYLYAFPIQQSIVAVAIAGGAPVGPLALFAIAVPLSLAAGALSWHGVERHFLPRRRSAAHDVAPAPAAVDAVADAR